MLYLQSIIFKCAMRQDLLFLQFFHITADTMHSAGFYFLVSSKEIMRDYTLISIDCKSHLFPARGILLLVSIFLFFFSQSHSHFKIYKRSLISFSSRLYCSVSNWIYVLVRDTNKINMNCLNIACKRHD